MFEIADYTNVNTVEVFNLSGQSVLTADITSSTTTIDVSTLNKGVYFYNIKGANGETLSTNKLVVTK